MSLKMVCLPLSLLNKVVEIIFGTDKIAYIYSSAGVKVQKRVTEDGVVTLTDYLEGFQYVGGALSFLPTAEGFFTAEANAYVYQYRDHLGNVRLSYSDKNENNIIEVNEIIAEMNYYPFGLAHKGYNEKNDALMIDYKYGYNGKESQEELGLNYYDYGARHYDAAIGRWMSVDPLAEHPKQVGTSPYAYVANNPINLMDPTGMIWEDPKQAERLSKSINNRIEKIENSNTKIQAQIDKGGLNDKKLVKLEGLLTENSQKIELLNQSLTDIEAIGNAAETYKLTRPSASDGTHGVVKDADGVINIEGSNTGLHIHEIRHVGQSMKAGGVRFSKEGRLINAGTTYERARYNEVNAYQTQYSFDGSYPAGASSLKDISPATLMNIKFPDGRSVYEKLKDKKK